MYFYSIFILGAISYFMLSVVYHDACPNYQTVMKTRRCYTMTISTY